MEEGGGDSFEEVSRRLAVGARRGRRELEDVAGYHTDLGITHPFTGKAKLQPTWAKLIRVLLSAQGQTPTKEEVRAYQQQRWARSDDTVCLLELLPLPSPSTHHWLYGEHSQLPELATRERYREIWSVRRVQALRQRIAAHQPPVVIFYGLGYRDYWAAIAGAKMRPALDGEIAVYDTEERLYVAMKHPITRGATSEDYRKIGRFIRDVLDIRVTQHTPAAETVAATRGNVETSCSLQWLN